MKAEGEFAAYVEAAERRIPATPGVWSEAVSAAYKAVAIRFRSDLGDGRDDLVSRAGALMLAEALLGQSEVVPNPLARAATFDDMALAVAYVSLHDRVLIWKTIDYSITERWHQHGWIEDPRGKSKSMVLTPEGLERARQVTQRLFGSPGGHDA